MKTKFLEFVATTNHQFMFHKADDDKNNIVAYDMFGGNMKHIAIVRFYQDEDKIMCQLTEPDGKLIADMDTDHLIRENDGELISIWQCGFNDLAEKARKKLKLKSS